MEKKEQFPAPAVENQDKALEPETLHHTRIKKIFERAKGRVILPAGEAIQAHLDFGKLKKNTEKNKKKKK